MGLNNRIKAFSRLGSFLSQFDLSDTYEPIDIDKNVNFQSELIKIVNQAKHYNGWFTRDNMLFALKQWGQLLTEENLQIWLKPYHIEEKKVKSVGLILAGNIPLVGFHDFLSVLITGHKALVKLSSTDPLLIPFITSFLQEIEPEFENKVTFVKDRLEGYDAVIATGSNNTSRYFEHYFKNVPSIIRKNRNSIAILTGNETKEELIALGEDIFRYYGLGCRSVSKIYVPESYNFDSFFEALYLFKDIIEEPKYANNYDYNKAVYLMSNYKLFENGFLMLKEDESFGSPIATVFYQRYENTKELFKLLKTKEDQLQCVVSNGLKEDHITFGQTQQPKLSDYADNIDTIEFLTTIS